MTSDFGNTEIVVYAKCIHESELGAQHLYTCRIHAIIEFSTSTPWVKNLLLETYTSSRTGV